MPSYNPIDLWGYKWTSDRKLYPKDKIYILSNDELDFLSSAEFVSLFDNDFILDPKVQLYRNCKGLKSFIRYLRSNNSNDFGHPNSFIINYLKEYSYNSLLINTDIQNNENFKCPLNLEEDANLLISVLEHLTILDGDVPNTGIYFSGQELDINRIIKYLGYQNKIVKYHPSGKLVSLTSPSVKLSLSYDYKSEINLQDTDKLSDLLKNSNFISNDTYSLFGIIFRKDKVTNLLTNKTFNLENILFRRK